MIGTTEFIVTDDNYSRYSIYVIVSILGMEEGNWQSANPPPPGPYNNHVSFELLLMENVDIQNFNNVTQSFSV